MVQKEYNQQDELDRLQDEHAGYMTSLQATGEAYRLQNRQDNLQDEQDRLQDKQDRLRDKHMVCKTSSIGLRINKTGSRTSRIGFMRAR
jgi:hypothetical protein